MQLAERREYCPAAHGAHVAAPAPLNRPEVQPVHAVDAYAPVAALYFPAGQFVQLAMPESDWY